MKSRNLEPLSVLLVYYYILRLKCSGNFEKILNGNGIFHKIALGNGNPPPPPFRALNKDFSVYGADTPGYVCVSPFFFLLSACQELKLHYICIRNGSSLSYILALSTHAHRRSA